MLPSALKKSTENTDKKETKCVKFSRENNVKATSEKEGILAVAALKVEKDSMEQVDKVDAKIDEVDSGILYQDEPGSVKGRKGKKVIHTDSLKCNRARLSKTLED